MYVNLCTGKEGNFTQHNPKIKPNSTVLLLQGEISRKQYVCILSYKYQPLV